ncbi:hypothetical protein DFQ26_009506, partial [Actinomortierella ambigua]
MGETQGLMEYHSSIALSHRKALGSGAFGTVHEARWGNQPCAAKTFFLSPSEFDRQSIRKEISVLKKLRFRHVIQFYRTHEENDRIYLLMELAERGSLEQAINRGVLSSDDWSTKSRLASEIAQGLDFIHKEKILHRDIRSGNVLLNMHMEVKLVDLRLATVNSMTFESMSVTQSVSGIVGTLRWIAPELFYASKPEYSTKSDVYALGVVMWEMAANCTRPYKDQIDGALIAVHVSHGGRETFPEDTPTEYREWAERCWHQNPVCRPDASEVVQIH